MTIILPIEGETSLAFNEDVTERFPGYGWHVHSVADGNNIDTIAAAIENARKRNKTAFTH